MNKKSKLLINLIKNDILIIEKDKVYLNYDFFKKSEVKKILYVKKDIDQVIILQTKCAIFKYWLEQDILIPPWETHWFQLKETYILKLELRLLTKLLNKGIQKAGNINQLCRSLSMSVPSFYNYLNRKKNIEMVSIKKLRRLLSYLRIPYAKINNKIEYTKKGKIISIKKPKFPFNLKTISGASLLGYIVSDGCLYIDKKARGVIRTKYSSSETESIEEFIKLINETYGKFMSSLNL